MRKRLLWTGFCAAAIVWNVTNVGAQDADEVEIEVVHVVDGLYMLLGQGGNIGVSVGEDGVFLIDDQFAPVSGEIEAAVAGLSDAPIRFVLNTHWHGDHTGGNEHFGETGALIVAHDNVRQRMSTEQFMSFFDRTVPPSPDAALPVVTFNDAVTFHLNGEEIRAFHVAHAHTDGDTVIYFPRANVVHMGDVYFSSSYPFIDVDSGGSIDGMIEATDRVLGLIDEETKVIPGHGPVSDKQGLQAYRDMLAAIRDRVKTYVDAGLSVDQAVAERPTAEYDEAWGQGFMQPDRFVHLVHASLSGEVGSD